MGAMDAFLTRLTTPGAKAIYNGLTNAGKRAAAFNQALAAADVPCGRPRSPAFGL